MGIDIGPGVKIAPSVLSADFSRLAEEVKAVQQAGADLLHLDVMDGHFVPNITFGPAVVSSIKSHAEVPLDVHLMIENPELYVDDFVASGADILTVHVEACPHLHQVIQQVKSRGIKAAVSLNPSTPISAVQHVYDDVDMILIMSVNPGFGGQQFIDSMLSKIRALKDEGLDGVDIQVDGGIDRFVATDVVEAGANILVAGTSVFKTDDYKKSIKALRKGS